MKFLHAADIHLDSPMRGLASYEGAPEDAMRSATRQAFEGLIDLALDEQVEFLLIAGDLYDGDWRDYNTGLYFVRQITRLADAEIPVFIIAGNHDAASALTKKLRLPENCVMLSTKDPDTRSLDNLGVSIHGQGFATKAVVEDLSSAYPAPISDHLNIGMLHTSANGRVGHENYAPCKVAELVAHGYDYWALGHVHTREILNESPWVVFPGNLQGRHARETGGKGATLVSFEDGQITGVEHRDLDVARWTVCKVDVSAALSEDDVIIAVSDALVGAVEASEDRLLAARVVISGSSKAHDAIATDIERFTNEVRAQAVGIGADRVWIEKVKVKTSSLIDIDEARDRDDAIGELLRSLRDLSAGDLDEIAEQFATLRSKLPVEIRQGDEPFDPADPDTLRAMLSDVEQMLLARLIGGEG